MCPCEHVFLNIDVRAPHSPSLQPRTSYETLGGRYNEPPHAALQQPTTQTVHIECIVLITNKHTYWLYSLQIVFYSMSHHHYFHPWVNCVVPLSKDTKNKIGIKIMALNNMSFSPAYMTACVMSGTKAVAGRHADLCGAGLDTHRPQCDLDLHPSRRRVNMSAASFFCIFCLL